MLQGGFQERQGQEKEAILAGRVSRPAIISESDLERSLNDTAATILLEDPARYAKLSPAERDRRLKGDAVYRMRQRIKSDLAGNLDMVRRNQTEISPGASKKFAKNFMSDVSAYLLSIPGTPYNEDEYDVVFYSSRGTLLDYALGADCFVDIVRINEDGSRIPIDHCFIDFTCNPEKALAWSAEAEQRRGKLSDILFYYDPALVRETPGKSFDNVSDEIFKTDAYKQLVRFTGELLNRRLMRSLALPTGRQAKAA